jgi:hypothetical protein
MLLAGTYLSPKLKSKEVRVNKVLILPPEVVLVKSGIKGSETMLNESEATSNELYKTFSNVFVERQLTVANTPFTENSLKSSAELRQILNKVQTRYDVVAEQMNSKKKDVKKGRFTLGDEISIVPGASEIDAVVFTHINGTMLTGGKKAFGILVAGPSRSSSKAYISIVDAKTGDVLALQDLMVAGDIYKNPDKALHQSALKTLKKIGIGSGK